jgi:hypothetical protein
MKTIAEFIPAALYALLVGSLVWVGVAGLRGRAIYIPPPRGINQDLTQGATVTGYGARILGLGLLLVAALLVYAAALGFSHP